MTNLLRSITERNQPRNHAVSMEPSAKPKLREREMRGVGALDHPSWRFSRPGPAMGKDTDLV